MSKRNRFRDLAFIGLFVTVALLFCYGLFQMSVYEANGTARIQSQAERQQRQAQIAISKCRQVLLVNRLICISDAYATKREAQRTEEDLQAQQGMVKVAYWVFIFTGVQALVGVVGIYFVARTLDKTDEAVTLANRTANDAQQIGEAQVRAYLHCKSAKYKLTKDSAIAVLHLENTGQSPASKVLIRGSVSRYLIGGFPNARPLTFATSSQNEAWGEPIVSRGIVAAEIPFFWDFDFTVEDEHEAMREMRKETFVEGNEVQFDLVVSWADVFKKRHSFSLTLRAATNASPYSPNKKRSRSGVLEFTVDDPRYHSGDDDSQ